MSKMEKFFGILLISIFIVQTAICGSTSGPKIAIIGGGIGGASASHYLTELFDGELSIDLFEAKKLGGRLATVEMDGNEFEAGGAVIHERNLLMKNFVKLLGIEERPTCRGQKFAIWNKDEFVFEESSWQILSLAKLVYRYGLQPFRLHSYVNTVLDSFANIYKLQDEGVAFTNVSGLLGGMSERFPEMLKISLQDRLSKLGYSSGVINELVEATLVVNYGQNTDVQSFVGCVSIAGAGAALWSVKGGNKMVPKHLIYRNGRVKVVPSAVKKIVLLSANANEHSLYEVHYSNNGSSDIIKTIYNIVIIATPLTSDHDMPIEFSGFPETTNLNFPGVYQTTHTTFVHGDLNLTYFGLEDPIDGVLSCDPEKTIVSSIGNVESVVGTCSRVWKIFSRNQMEKTLIDQIFTKVEDVKSMAWKAYPKYVGEPRLDFKIHNSLYHVNAIEWAASAMEMSAIGGRNVAILAFNEYKNIQSTKKSSNAKKSKSKLEKMSRYVDL